MRLSLSNLLGFKSQNPTSDYIFAKKSIICKFKSCAFDYVWNGLIRLDVIFMRLLDFKRGLICWKKNTHETCDYIF